MKHTISMGMLVILGLALPLSALAERADEQHNKRLSKVMAKLDTNEDGTISQSEFRLPEDRGTPEMRMDLDGDGNISRDEVSDAITQHTDRALARFAELDIDGNGVVTGTERRQAAFNRIDTDADGQLTENEMRKARGAMRQERMRHGRKGDRKQRHHRNPH